MARKFSVPEFVPWVHYIGFAHRSTPQFWHPWHTPPQYQYVDPIPWYGRMFKQCADPLPPPYTGGAAL
eukprot:1516336-Karenia_brevis.AAC.1